LQQGELQNQKDLVGTERDHIPVEANGGEGRLVDLVLTHGTDGMVAGGEAAP
jgi:hypothetical protein